MNQDGDTSIAELFMVLSRKNCFVTALFTRLDPKITFSAIVESGRSTFVAIPYSVCFEGCKPPVSQSSEFSSIGHLVAYRVVSLAW